MRLYYYLPLFVLASCNFETKVSGIIIDKSTRQPVGGVHVKTIKDIKNSTLELETVNSAMDGRFTLSFSTHQSRANEVFVELSKQGYQTNGYYCHQDKQNDTLFLQRLY
jgi:5-hydroxyisourate hydrolase-like protein (transthyretin family)